MKAATHQDRQNREVSLESGHKGSIFGSAASCVAKPAALVCKAPVSLLPARGPLPRHRAFVLHRAPTCHLKKVHCMPPWHEDQSLCARLHTVNCPAASVSLHHCRGGVSVHTDMQRASPIVSRTIIQDRIPMPSLVHAPGSCALSLGCGARNSTVQLQQNCLCAVRPEQNVRSLPPR